MAKLKMKDSPRLQIEDNVVCNLKEKLHSPYLKRLADAVLHDADKLVRSKPVEEGRQPTYQTGTRMIHNQLECLTAAWVLTKDSSFRKAAIRHLAALAKWNHISCEARSNTPKDAELPFCLSYGELSYSVALMFDMFKTAGISDEERQVFFSVLDKFLMRAAVKCLDNPPWWANKAWSNWNGVCCGGMGVMALAFYDDHPDAPKLIPFVEKSLDPYFRSYIESGGGCAEGTGYWNYAMNYSMRYVLSWERATGKKHPALRIRQLVKSLTFPLDFTGITFGDNDGWGPSGFFFLLAERTNQHHAALNAAAYLPETFQPGRSKTHGGRPCNGDLLFAADCIPGVKEMEKLRKEHEKRKVPVARIYKGLDWAVLADDEAFPSLRMAIRGGTNKITGHGMVDLLSFRCRVNGELMITCQADGPYLSTTFGRRGSEIYSRSAASKSTLFVEGVGTAGDAECKKTERVKGEGITGVRLDATGAYLKRMPAKFIGRLFLFVDNQYWLVIDHVVGKTEVDELTIESRFHTYAACKLGRNAMSLKAGRERMQITFAALQPLAILESRGTPPVPMEQTKICSVLGKNRVVDNFHVAALNPGSKRLNVSVAKRKSSYVISVEKPDGSVRELELTSALKLKNR